MKLILTILIFGVLLLGAGEAEAGKGKGHKPTSGGLLDAPACSVTPDPAPRWTWVHISGSGFVPAFFTDPLDGVTGTDVIYSVVITAEGQGPALTGTDVQPDGTIALDYFAVFTGTNTVTVGKKIDGVIVSAKCTFEAT